MKEWRIDWKYLLQKRFKASYVCYPEATERCELGPYHEEGGTYVCQRSKEMILRDSDIGVTTPKIFLGEKI
jgi:hypothetical protein